jgi:hypothetical protein
MRLKPKCKECMYIKVYPNIYRSGSGLNSYKEECVLRKTVVINGYNTQIPLCSHDTLKYRPTDWYMKDVITNSDSPHEDKTA